MEHHDAHVDEHKEEGPEPVHQQVGAIIIINI
jgi:hypothetical protein